MQDIPARAREITLHGVHHDAVHALTAAQLQLSQDLRGIETGYPAIEDPDAHEDLVKDFANHAAAIANTVPPLNVLKHVFED